MKYIWMVVYALVWILVLCDGIHSVIVNIKDGEDFEFWFDDMPCRECNCSYMNKWQAKEDKE